ncbi:MAG: pyridoxal phosphate-dependent aminotransferase, partial [Oscillospiraceae bacterium]
MKELSRVASAVQASTTLAIDAMFKQMKADGVDVIGFGAGEPDFNTPEHIKEAGIAAIRQNKTKYTPSSGILELRRAVCSRLATDYGVTYEPSQIVAASGAKHNVFAALQALVNPGDEVIILAPYWVSYYELVKMAGAVPVIVTATEADGFQVTPRQLKAAITPKTKALLLNNPSNPTGMVYEKPALEAIAKLCVEEDLYVIADEIYDKLVYDGLQFTSFVTLGEDVRERTILINGVSKSYAMTGWRIGYSASNGQIAKVMTNFLSHSTAAPSSISQWAAAEALGGSQDTVEEMRRQFEERRNYLVERMNRIDGVSCIRPQGAFYVMMNMEKLRGKTLGGIVMNGSDDFARAFLERGLVAVVPCSGFGADSFVRWSYATSMENIREGLDRLERFLRDQV